MFSISAESVAGKKPNGFPAQLMLTLGYSFLHLVSSKYTDVRSSQNTNF